jgi:mannan endo-1,4-beta-mannosidase
MPSEKCGKRLRVSTIRWISAFVVGASLSACSDASSGASADAGAPNAPAEGSRADSGDKDVSDGDPEPADPELNDSEPANTATSDPATADPDPDAAAEGGPDGIGAGDNASGPQLVDAQATEEAVQLFAYLKSIEGRQSLAGIWENSGLMSVESASGRVAALLGQDMGGWHPRGSDYWYVAMEEQRNSLIRHYNDGGVVQVNWHWDNPFDHSLDAWSDITSRQWENLITPGTEEHETLLADIDLHVTNYLTYLVDDAERPIPALFRPLHEIDGGWFWWTCDDDPAKSAELYRIIYRRITEFHGLHNLIWVWNNSEVVTSAQRSGAFYPGDEYVDIVAWDGYHVDYDKTGLREEWDGSTKSYRFYWDLLGEIAPGKPRALGEGDALPNPDEIQGGAENFVPWLYALAWWAPVDGDGTGVCYTSPCNPAEWVDFTYNHEFYVTRDELPF